jgi:hypothetical protein
MCRGWVGGTTSGAAGVHRCSQSARLASRAGDCPERNRCQAAEPLPGPCLEAFRWVQHTSWSKQQRHGSRLLRHPAPTMAQRCSCRQRQPGCCWQSSQGWAVRGCSQPRPGSCCSSCAAAAGGCGAPPSQQQQMSWRVPALTCLHSCRSGTLRPPNQRSRRQWRQWRPCWTNARGVAAAGAPLAAPPPPPSPPPRRARCASCSRPCRRCWWRCGAAAGCKGGTAAAGNQPCHHRAAASVCGGCSNGARRCGTAWALARPLTWPRSGRLCAPAGQAGSWRQRRQPGHPAAAPVHIWMGARRRTRARRRRRRRR